MKNKDYFNVIIVSASGLFTLIVSTLLGFVLPKLVSIDDYAYYQVYALYTSFAGFLHLGFVNGVYLRYGAFDYEKLPQEKFRKYFRILLLTQVIISIIIAIATQILITGNKRYVFLFVAVNITLLNLNSYFSYINQFTKRFLMDSIFSIIQSLIQILLMIWVCMTEYKSYIYILLFLSISNIIRLLCSLSINRKICFGKTNKIKIFDDIQKIIKAGFFIMISEWMGIVITSIDKLFVDTFFDVKLFSFYAFAISVVTAIYSVINISCTVVFPYLVRADKNKYSLYYNQLSNLFIILAGIVMCGYLPLDYMIRMLLPQYIHSLKYIFILFPTIIFKALFSMVSGNMYKAMQLSKEYSKNTIFALTIACISDAIAYIAFKSTYAIAIASLLTFVIWYIYTDIFFIKKLYIEIKEYIFRWGLIILEISLFVILLNEGVIFKWGIYVVFNVVMLLVYVYKLMKIRRR